MSRLWPALIVASLLQAAFTEAKTQTVFLLRHAEKSSDPGSDPALSEAGVTRAARLPGLFEQALPQAVFSTQYQRTQLTAKPLADAAGLAISIIAANKETAASYPELLRERICAMPDHSIAVVVGHSNTIPEIISQWTTEPVAAIDDKRFDRIFMVRLDDCKSNTYLESTY
jgi:phosphohistidine phosphatase SixA